MRDTDDTSINDLLSHEDEVPAQARRSAAVDIAKIIGYAAALAAVVVLGLRVGGTSVPYVLAFTAALAVLVLRRLLGLVAAPPPPRAALSRTATLDDDATYQWGTTDGLRFAVGRWESRLEWGYDSADRFARRLQPRLVEFVDERLRQRHGISRATDPARARELLGEPLWTFVQGPVGKVPAPREFVALVARMEEL